MLSVLTSLLVSVDVKIYCTMLRHWSQLVPNMSYINLIKLQCCAHDTTDLIKLKAEGLKMHICVLVNFNRQR